MVSASADQTKPAPNPRPKRKRIGGRPPPITPAIVDFVAGKVAQGVPLYYAVRLINPPVYSVQDWNAAMNRTPVLLARYEQRQAEWLDTFTGEMQTIPLSKMPAKVWIAERRYPEHYGTKQHGTNINVNVNTLVGVEDSIVRRAASFIKRGERPVFQRPAMVQDAKKELEPIHAEAHVISNSTEKVIDPPK